MKASRRALAIALTTAGLLATPAAGHAASSPCQRLYTPGDFTHMLHRAYEGTSEPPDGTYAPMRAAASCQIYPGGRRWARRAWRHAHYRWAVRRRALPPMNVSTVSWYEDAGQTASGTHSYYGFAACGYGDCVPMGTRVEFCAERCVVATRDDSGPYVGGRAFDINENVAAAIGFDGLGPVRWRLVN